MFFRKDGRVTSAAGLVCACFFVLSHQALATTFTCTWSGLGADNNWQTDGNWDLACNGGAPHVPHANDDLVFPESAARKSNNNDNAADTAFNSITFTGSGYFIGGNEIALGTAGITQTLGATSTAGNTLSTNLKIAGATTIATSSSAASIGTLDLQGTIVDGGSAGSFVITGDTLLQTHYILHLNNTYSGGTTVSQNAYIQASSNNSFGTGLVTATGTATINPFGNTIPNTGHFSGLGQGNQGIVSGFGIWSGPIVLTGNAGFGAAGTMSFTGNISESGGAHGLTAPQGAGSGGQVTLSGNNTYTGQTTVGGLGTNGKLIVNGSQASSNVVVNAGQTLLGIGTTGAVTLNSGAAHLAPGQSPGIINTGNLSIPSGSNLDIELNQILVGAQYDQVNVTGTVTLGGTLNIALGFVPAPGNTFTIINNDGADPVSGTFAGRPEGAIFVVGSTAFRITYAGGTNNNDVVLTAQLVSPPPTIAKSFGAANILLNGSTSLTFTITNPNASGLTGVGFTDTLPAGLVVSTPNGLTGSCGGGTITATAGSSSVSLTGATLAASASCNFSVNVTGNTLGPQNNTTGAVTSNESGTGGTASASVTVLLTAPTATAVPSLQQWALWLLGLLILLVTPGVLLRRRKRN